MPLIEMESKGLEVEGGAAEVACAVSAAGAEGAAAASDEFGAGAFAGAAADAAADEGAGACGVAVGAPWPVPPFRAAS